MSLFFKRREGETGTGKEKKKKKQRDTERERETETDSKIRLDFRAVLPGGMHLGGESVIM